MDEKLIIRTETEDDYTNVEHITRDAFWNLSIPGCDEHYLAHIMRKHEDFIPELDFVAELNGQVIGNVMYTKSKLVNISGTYKQILTFGPISILPKYQRRGYSRILLEYSFQRALELGYDMIVIFGNPGNYVGCGFRSCKKYNICMASDGSTDVYPAAMLVKELRADVLDGSKWYCELSPVYNIDCDEAQKFDELFESREKKYQPSQEEFYIHSHSVIQ